MTGNRPARLILTVAVAGIASAFVVAWSVTGNLPFSLSDYRALDIGMMVDVALIFLFFVLARRLRLSRLETEQARERLMEVTRLHAQELEEEITVRTQELRDANALKDKFCSIVAHDLRGPISGLAAYFSAIKSVKDLTNDDLAVLRGSIESTYEFLEKLLTWSRTQRGDIECKPTAFDLSDILTQINDLFSVKAYAEGIELHLEVGDGYRALADMSMTHTVLRNLVHNALKYTKSGGEVHASVIYERDTWLIQISDTGIGMDEQTLATLFRHPATSLDIPATAGKSGLGLILCKEFVEKNGGTIGAKSVQGHGSTFWFTLPALWRDSNEAGRCEEMA